MSGWGHAAFAAAVIRGCRSELAARGSNVLREVSGRTGEIADWRHYPDGDGYDLISHAQYFFHRHSEPDALNEIGHFHLFLRAEGMPEGMSPLLLPETAIANPRPQAAPSKRGLRDEVSHLVAIAIDAEGDPVRLFTTNRWVTGETWYRAEDVIGMLDHFVLDAAEPAGFVNFWLAAIVRLYRQEIAALLLERDRTVMDPRRRRRGTDIFEDSRMEITSSLPIDLHARLAAVERHDAGGAVAARPQSPSRLPRMAEGWGS